MLNNATGFKKIYIACGQTDLRRGIEGLANIIRFQFQLDPYDKDTYKRLDVGAFSWPRNTAEALEITSEQYKLLMEGFSIVAKRPITELTNPPRAI